MYIHLLNLDTIGGVEALYAFFLASDLNCEQRTCVTGKHPHKKFEKIFGKINHKPFLERYIGPFRLPRFFRSFITFRRNMIEHIAHPTCWVYWNRIEESLPPGKMVYYEHGAAWTDRPTKKRMAFLKHASLFLANSEAAAIMLQKKWSIPSPIHIIPNPLRPDISIREAPKQLNTPTRLGFLGRLLPIKGVGVALHTLNELRKNGIDATLSIGGTGSEEAFGRMLAKKLNINESVIWHGLVGDITSFFDSIDLLLVPSLREPLGLVALEASARGVPVIAAHVDGLPEVVQNGITGMCIDPTLDLAERKDFFGSSKGFPDFVVNPLSKNLIHPKLVDPKLYAHAITSIITDEKIYVDLSRNSLEFAKTKSSFSSYVSAIHEHLNTLSRI